MIKDYYHILALKKDASSEQIKKAYRAKALQFHPDRNGNSDQAADLFLEIKEAYQVLSDPNARVIYDQLYHEHFSSNSDQVKSNQRTRVHSTETNFGHSGEKTQDKNHSSQEKTTNSQTKNTHSTEYDRRTRDPYSVMFPPPFYTASQRSINRTPKNNPVSNHWGEPLSEDAVFFTLPGQIGLLVSGYTDLKAGKKPFTKKQIWHRFLMAASISCVASIAIIHLFGVDDTAWQVVWAAVPLGLFLWLAQMSTSFKHINTFIGVNGFASYTCQTRPDNVTKDYEVNFQHVTDLVVITQINKRNFTYQSTSYCFLWFNGGKLLLTIEGEQYSEENNPDRKKTDFWLNTHAQSYWTVFLLDGLEAQIQQNGFVEFNVFEYNKSSGSYKKTPYIRLGPGLITFFSDKGEVTYTKSEIKKVYTRGPELFIEHVNYQKKFFFFESGNKNGIPLLNLSNRQFFFKAFELLLGYQLS